MKIEKTIEVDTTPTKAYKLLSDPTNIPRYTPDIENVTVTAITPRLVGTRMMMRTSEHREIEGEVVEATLDKGCAFRTNTGRTIRWAISEHGKHTRLVNTIETNEDLDEQRVLPELDRKLRHLRNQFQIARV